MIKIRAHHLLCIPRYYNKGGYNKKYADNFKKIDLEIRKNPDLKIKIIKRCDDICSKCPYKKGNICKKEDKINSRILMQDNRILKRLEIKNNSVYEAKDIFNLSTNKIKDKDLKSMCRIKTGCEFLPLCSKYGINKSFQRDLNKTK